MFLIDYTKKPPNKCQKILVKSLCGKMQLKGLLIDIRGDKYHRQIQFELPNGSWCLLQDIEDEGLIIEELTKWYDYTI